MSEEFLRKSAEDTFYKQGYSLTDSRVVGEQAVLLYGRGYNATQAVEKALVFGRKTFKKTKR